MPEDIAGNLDRQRELYGEPLRDLADRVMSALGLTQGRLAEALGLSAPMLSQLLSGRRVKIGNPAVLHRLQSLLDLADEAPSLTAEELSARMTAARDVQGTFTTGRGARDEQHAAAVGALQARASASELDDAAALLAARHPRLAALLREAATEAAGG